MNVIAWKRLKQILNKKSFDEFDKWMMGQTSVDVGVFEHDFLRWVKQLPIID